KPEEERIDWNKSAFTLNNMVRGMNPFPGAHTLLSGQRFKLWETEPLEKNHDAIPGTIIVLNKNECIIACGDNTALSLKNVQPFGKPKMPIRDFLAGALNYLKEGMRFDNE
ncbi:MAG: methionyl-tRNA formyltransferase, partial [Alkalibacterium sp.]